MTETRFQSYDETIKRLDNSFQRLENSFQKLEQNISAKLDAMMAAIAQHQMFMADDDTLYQFSAETKKGLDNPKAIEEGVPHIAPVSVKGNSGWVQNYVAPAIVSVDFPVDITVGRNLCCKEVLMDVVVGDDSQFGKHTVVGLVQRIFIHDVVDTDILLRKILNYRSTRKKQSKVSSHSVSSVELWSHSVSSVELRMIAPKHIILPTFLLGIFVMLAIVKILERSDLPLQFGTCALKVLGYFIMVGLLRVHCLLVDSFPAINSLHVGQNHNGNKALQGAAAKLNGKIISSYEALPAFRAVSSSDNLFVRKLSLGCVLFDFSDTAKHLNEKGIKRQALSELVDYVISATSKFSAIVIQEVIRMVSVNIFRTMNPQPRENKVVEGFDLEEEPAMDSAWPHLHDVYEFFLIFLPSTEIDAKLVKIYIERPFILKFLDLFGSEDSSEKDYLKTILHCINGQFMVHRPFIRQAINNIFYNFTFETDRHNGIAELLEILGSIINLFALPFKEEHKLFLVRALIPLHKPKCLSTYHLQLSYYITQSGEKKCKLARCMKVDEPTLRTILTTTKHKSQAVDDNGEPLPLIQSQVPLLGHVFEVRLYAENVSKGFLPATSILHHYHYDPMIAKLIVWGENRVTALVMLKDCLSKFKVAGLPTNITFLLKLANHWAFENGNVETHFIDCLKDDLLVDPSNSALAKEAYDAARLIVSMVAGCVVKMKQESAMKKNICGGNSSLSIWYISSLFRVPHCAGRDIELEWCNKYEDNGSKLLRLAFTYQLDGSYLIEDGRNIPAWQIKTSQLGNHEFRLEIDGAIMEVSLVVYSKDRIQHFHLWLKWYDRQSLLLFQLNHPEEARRHLQFTWGEDDVVMCNEQKMMLPELYILEDKYIVRGWVVMVVYSNSLGGTWGHFGHLHLQCNNIKGN